MSLVRPLNAQLRPVCLGMFGLRRGNGGGVGCGMTGRFRHAERSRSIVGKGSSEDNGKGEQPNSLK